MVVVMKRAQALAAAVHSESESLCDPHYRQVAQPFDFKSIHNYELCNVTQKSRKFTEILIYAVGNPRIYRSTNVSVISVNFCVTMNYEL